MSYVPKLQQSTTSVRYVFLQVLSECAGSDHLDEIRYVGEEVNGRDT